jgi:hypothetical protein
MYLLVVVAAETNPGTVQVENVPKDDLALKKALDKSKAPKMGYPEHAEDALCKSEAAGTDIVIHALYPNSLMVIIQVVQSHLTVALRQCLERKRRYLAAIRPTAPPQRPLGWPTGKRAGNGGGREDGAVHVGRDV